MLSKLYIIPILFIFFNVCCAQETFVRKYTKCISEINNKLGDWEDVDLTVVFNEKKTNNVVLYYPSKTIVLYKIGKLQTSKTNNGEEYQLIECLDDDGNRLALQLFSEAMRIIIDGGYIEFHE